MGISGRFPAVALAAVAAASVGLIGSAASASADASTSTACVEPTASVFIVARLNPRQYQVSLRDPATVTCTAFTFNISSYRIPDTWDRNGWNESALPQTEFAYTTLTFPAGGTGRVTGTIAVPDCGPYQTDIYTGPRLTYLQWPSPMAGVRLKGVMEDQAACSHETPTPSTSTTPAEVSPSTPAAETTTPAVAGTTASTSSAAAPAVESTPGSASVLPAKAGTAPRAPATQPRSEVLGTKQGALPHTGLADSLRAQALLALGLLLLGGAFLTAPLRKAAAPTRDRRH